MIIKDIRDSIWTITRDPGITQKTCSLREEPRTDPHPTLKNRTPTYRDRLDPLVASSVHRLRLSRCEFCCGFLCTELATTGSSLSRYVGVLFLSVGWGSTWGSSRRQQVFYVIPGSRVIVHIYSLRGSLVWLKIQGTKLLNKGFCL